MPAFAGMTIDELSPWTLRGERSIPLSLDRLVHFCYAYVMAWQDKFLTTTEQIRDLINDTRRIAVLGIKTDAQSDQPSVYVPQYLQRAGFDIVPIPVYYPEATEILGEKVYRKLADVPEKIDMVNVFRRSNDIPPHVEDILAARPKSVWFQAGIRHDEAARTLAENGIKVVQDLCLMVEHRYL